MFSFQEVLFSKECSARKTTDRIGEAEQQTQPVRCLYPERERERDRQTDRYADQVWRHTEIQTEPMRHIYTQRNRKQTKQFNYTYTQRNRKTDQAKRTHLLETLKETEQETGPFNDIYIKRKH